MLNRFNYILQIVSIVKTVKLVRVVNIERGKWNYHLVPSKSSCHQDLSFRVLDDVHTIVVERNWRSRLNFIILRIPKQDLVRVLYQDWIKSSSDQDPSSIRVRILNPCASRIRFVVQRKIQFVTPFLSLPVVNINLGEKFLKNPKLLNIQTLANNHIRIATTNQQQLPFGGPMLEFRYKNDLLTTTTCQQRPLFCGSSGGRCTQVWLFTNYMILILSFQS